jgi:hypothetical protein
MRSNVDVDWLIFTDDNTPYDWPENVRVEKMSFEELRRYVQSRFEFEVALNRPYKLCDFKPAYGYIFEEYLAGYEFWGHCDLDVVFGRIMHFLPDAVLDNYDKIFELGHMTIYRNSVSNNRRFMDCLHGEKRYQMVFSDNHSVMFDEGNHASVCTIWNEHGYSVWKEHYCADIVQKSCFFNLTDFDAASYTYHPETRRHQIFWWDHGILTLSYMEQGEYFEKEYMYIHLIRRTAEMRIHMPEDCERYKIIPHEFVELRSAITKETYNAQKWWNPNIHYLKIRFENIKSKLRKRMYNGI